MVQHTTNSMVLSEPKHLEQMEFEIPEIGDNEGLLRVEMTSICGSDISMYKGDPVSREYCPLLLGHEVVGWVDKAGEQFCENHDVTEGDRVVVEPYIPCYNCKNCQTGHYQLCDDLSCYGVFTSSEIPPHLWGGYGEYMYLDPNAKLHSISEKVPAEAACLSSVIGNGVRWAITKGKITPNESVAIAGPGVQGLASTFVSNVLGADPIVLMGLSTDERRLEVGRNLGATHTIMIDEEDAEERMKEITEDGQADCTIPCAPATSSIELCCDLVAPLGRVVVPAITDEKPSEIIFDDLIHKEARIITGFGQPNNMGEAVALVEKYPDLVEQMITHTFPVEEAETAIRRQISSNPEFDETIIHASLVPN